METTLDLTTLLPLTDGALTFAADTVPGIMLADQFNRLTNGLPIYVHDATRTVDNGTVRVSGSVNLSTLPTLPIVLELKSGDDGPELTTTLGLHDMAAAGGLRLNMLWQQLKLPTVSALPVDQLSVDGLVLVANKKNFSLTASMAKDPGWALNLGPAPLAVSDVRLTVAKPSGGAFKSLFHGKAAFTDSISLELDYDTAGTFGLRAPLPSVRLSQLVHKFSSQTLPASFDPTFDQGVVLIQGEKETLLFQVSANFAAQSKALFIAKRAAGAWGFVAGIDLGSVRLATVPGLEALDRFQNLFQLQHLLAVVASYDDAAFAFPSSAIFADPDNPAPQAGNLQLPNVGGGLVKGLNVYATWKLDPTNSQQRLLSGLLRVSGDLAVVLQLGANPATNSSLAVSYATTIKGMPFLCQFGGQISNGEVALFLRGQLQATIQGQKVTFDAALAFAPTGAFIAGSMQGSVQFYLDSSHANSLTLSNLALVVGINPDGIPSLGVAGTVTFNTFQLSLAMFFDSSNPAQSMLAGAVSNLKLYDLVTTLAHASVPTELANVLRQLELSGTSTVSIRNNVPALVAALDAHQLDAVLAALTAANVPLASNAQQALLVVGKAGTTWFLTDTAAAGMPHYQLDKQADGSLQIALNPQFYCAPQDVNLGSLVFKQGFFLTGRLKLFAFDASVKILVASSQGVAIDGTLSRIVIGTESLFALEDGQGLGQGPTLSVATFAQPTLADASLRGPHFLINGSLTMLGLKRSVYIRASDQGLVFDLNGPLSPLVPVISGDLHGHFTSPTDMGIGGTLTIGIPTLNLGGPLGSINLGTSVQASLDMGVRTTGMPGQYNGMPSQYNQYSGMPGQYNGGMPSQYGGMPNQRNGSMPGQYGGMPPDQVAAMMAKTLSNPMSSMLPPGMGQAPVGGTGAVQIWATVQLSAQVAGQALSIPPLNLQVSDTHALLNLPQQVASQLINELTRDAGRWARLVQAGLVTGVQDVGQALSSVYHLSSDQAKDVLQKAGFAASQVDKFLHSTYGTVAGGAQQAAGVVAGGIVHAAGTVASGAQHAAGTVASGAQQAASTVASGAQQAAHTVASGTQQVAQQAASTLNPTHW